MDINNAEISLNTDQHEYFSDGSVGSDGSVAGCPI